MASLGIFFKSVHDKIKNVCDELFWDQFSLVVMCSHSLTTTQYKWILHNVFLQFEEEEEQPC